MIETMIGLCIFMVVTTGAMTWLAIKEKDKLLGYMAVLIGVYSALIMYAGYVMYQDIVRCSI